MFDKYVALALALTVLPPTADRASKSKLTTSDDLLAVQA